MASLDSAVQRKRYPKFAGQLMDNALHLTESVGIGEIRFAHQAFHPIVGRRRGGWIAPKLVDEFEAGRPELIKQGVALFQRFRDRPVRRLRDRNDGSAPARGSPGLRCRSMEVRACDHVRELRRGTYPPDRDSRED